MKTLTVQQFFAKFPDDDACLEHLMVVRFGRTIECPKCWKKGNFTKLTKLPAYSCPWCGHHVHPMVGTPFERSHTALQKWFYAMYLFTTSRHGVPAKELQRQLGVTYKTAWRMAHEIRKYMAKVDGTGTLSGHVEVDETLVGGSREGEGYANRRRDKALVVGAVERGGEIVTAVVPNASQAVLEPFVTALVEPGSKITTDEWRAYNDLGALYDHQKINHQAKEFVRGDRHTNTIEGFWAIIKRSIRGTHVHVSVKHLPKYLGEFEFRWNRRATPWGMMDDLLRAF